MQVNLRYAAWRCPSQGGRRHCARAAPARGAVVCQASTPGAPSTAVAAEAEDKWIARNVLPLAASEVPAGLAQLRRTCSAVLPSLRMPTTRNESYRYTDIAPLLAARLVPAAAAAPETLAALVESLILPAAAATTAVVVDGVLSQQLSRLTGLPEGVALVGAAAAADAPAQAAALGQLSNFGGGPLAVINGAVAADALLVEVGAGVSASAPLHVLHLATTPGGDGAARSLAAPRLLLRLGQGASLELVEEFVTAPAGGGGGSGSGQGGSAGVGHVTLAMSEVFLGQHASLKHSYVEREAGGSLHFKSTLVAQAEGSQYALVEARVGGALARHDVAVQQLGPDTTTSMRHFLLAGSNQLQDLHSQLTLDHPRGSAAQLHKCIVSAASGRGVFDGNVKVNKMAQKTDAGQLSRNLLLLPRATVNVKPNLQIVADDVKCTHGCTVSDLSDEELFYFRARGIDAQAARQALVYSFGAEVVQGLGHEELVARVQADVVATLAEAVAGVGAA